MRSCRGRSNQRRASPARRTPRSESIASASPETTRPASRPIPAERTVEPTAAEELEDFRHDRRHRSIPRPPRLGLLRDAQPVRHRQRPTARCARLPRARHHQRRLRRDARARRHAGDARRTGGPRGGHRRRHLAAAQRRLGALLRRDGRRHRRDGASAGRRRRSRVLDRGLEPVDEQHRRDRRGHRARPCRGDRSRRTRAGADGSMREPPARCRRLRRHPGPVCAPTSPPAPRCCTPRCCGRPSTSARSPRSAHP